MANNQEQAAREKPSPTPDAEDRSPTERRKVEHVTGFQGDTQQMPLDGDDAVDHGGTSRPPISSVPVDEAEEIIEQLPTTGQA